VSMQEYLEEPTQELEPEPQDAPSSLSVRMERRHEELSRQQTEKFPLPGWEDLLEVELRPLGMRAATKIVQRNQRTRDEATRSLYVTCDLLLTATVGFHQVAGERSTPITDDMAALRQRRHRQGAGGGFRQDGVTQLAVACAMLEIPVDPVELFRTEDGLLIQWLSVVAEGISAKNRQQAAEAKRKRR
jgi:hypothetical protein